MATMENVLPYDRPKLSKVGAILPVDALVVMATEMSISWCPRRDYAHTQSESVCTISMHSAGAIALLCTLNTILNLISFVLPSPPLSFPSPPPPPPLTVGNECEG